MVTANDHPRPWVLLCSPPEGFATHVASRVPTSRTDDPFNGVYEEREWDAAVTFRDDSTGLSDNLHVLSFGATEVRGSSAGRGRGPLRRNRVSQGTVLTTAAETPATVERLLADTVMPHIDTTASLYTWTQQIGDWSTTATGDLEGAISPWLHVGPKSQVLAFEYIDAGQIKPTLHWVLPAETQDQDLWFDAFIRRLREFDPKIFPSDPDWATGIDWAPPEVRKHVLEVQALHDELERETRRLDNAIAAAEGEIEAASDAAKQGPLRLLTEQGEPLREAVQEALGDLGFEVTDMDPIHEEKHGAKFEDLQATDPDDDAWIAIIEVKGFAKGVKVTEIDKVTRRPLRRYLLDHGSEPSAVWAIANHNMKQPPDGRGPFVSNPETDLHAFIDTDGGACFDTRDLYQAWRAVQTGELDADEARAWMKNVRGLASFSSAPVPNAE